jgi:hypothetical protein
MLVYSVSAIQECLSPFTTLATALLPPGGGGAPFVSRTSQATIWQPRSSPRKRTGPTGTRCKGMWIGNVDRTDGQTPAKMPDTPRKAKVGKAGSELHDFDPPSNRARRKPLSTQLHLRPAADFLKRRNINHSHFVPVPPKFLTGHGLLGQRTYVDIVAGGSVYGASAPSARAAGGIFDFLEPT